MAKRCSDSWRTRTSKGVVFTLVAAAAFGGLFYQLQRVRAVQAETLDAASQCETLFRNAAKQLAVPHAIEPLVTNVEIQRFKASDGGPARLDCSADVSFDHRAPGNHDTWYATGRAGEQMRLISVKFYGDEKVDQVSPHN